MATPARRLIQDQNLNILYNGTTPGQKTDVPKADKKARLAGRKALNDISNSRKPSVPHTVKKDNSTNVISVEKEPIVVKSKILKATTEKGKVGGRKALTDLTNSVKPPAKQGLNIGRKLNAVADENVTCVAEERFLHNHQECIKAQMKAVDMGYFLKSVGLNNDIPMQPSARRAIPFSPKKLASNTKHSEMQEMSLEDQVLQCCSPAFKSPQSPEAPYMSWDDDKLSELLTVIETPKLM